MPSEVAKGLSKEKETEDVDIQTDNNSEQEDDTKIVGKIYTRLGQKSRKVEPYRHFRRKSVNTFIYSTFGPESKSGVYQAEIEFKRPNLPKTKMAAMSD